MKKLILLLVMFMTLSFTDSQEWGYVYHKTGNGYIQLHLPQHVIDNHLNNHQDDFQWVIITPPIIIIN